MRHLNVSYVIMRVADAIFYSDLANVTQLSYRIN